VTAIDTTPAPPTSTRSFPTWARALVTVSALPIVALGHAVTFAALDSPSTPNLYRPAMAVGNVGLQALITASVLVEVCSLMSRRWSEARVAGPESFGHRMRVTIALGLVIATFQAGAIANFYHSSTRTVDTHHPLIVVTTLLAGFALQVTAARLLGRWGLVNGVLALVAALAVFNAAHDQVVPGPWGVDAVAWRPAVLAASAAALAVLAVLALARRSRTAPSVATGAPYRDPTPRAPTAIAVPPAPVGVVAILIASTVRDLLATYLGLFHPGALSWGLAHVVLSVAIAFALGSRLASPSRLIALWSRALGRPLSGDAAAVVTAEARRAVWSGCAFALALASIAAFAPMKVWAVALGAAVCVDAVRAARARSGADDWTEVWAEPRAIAVPPALEALRIDGIPAYAADGFGASMLPWIGPVAPTLIMVHAADVGRAREVLARVLPPGAREPEPVADDAHAPIVAARPRRMFVQAGIAFGVVVVASAALIKLASFNPETAPARRASLQLRYVDDAAGVRLFEGIALPSGGAKLEEHAPNGPGDSVTTQFVRIVPAEGETLDAARARLVAWSAGVAVPPECQLGVTPWFELDDEDGDREQAGWRTMVLRGDPVLTEHDVQDAFARQEPDTDRVVVSITLTPDGGLRFEDATRRWKLRRIAIVVDGVIMSAPVVQSVIIGGALQITMGGGTHERRLAEAKELAAALGGPTTVMHF
jgi:hypothetical protein